MKYCEEAMIIKRAEIIEYVIRFNIPKLKKNIRTFKELNKEGKILIKIIKYKKANKNKNQNK